MCQSLTTFCYFLFYRQKEKTTKKDTLKIYCVLRFNDLCVKYTKRTCVESLLEGVCFFWPKNTKIFQEPKREHEVKVENMLKPLT